MKLRVACPDLRALVIEPRRSSEDCSDTCKYSRHGFLRAHRIDMYGRMTVIAEPISEALIKYHEPDYEVLEEKDRFELMW